jgi:hypothetical protein
LTKFGLNKAGLPEVFQVYKKQIALAVFILAALMGLSSCQKRNRLAVSSVIVKATPRTVTLAPGGIQELSATVSSVGSEINITPEWSVTNSLGSFSAASGKTVTFTAGSNTGTGTIYATADSVTSSVNLVIAASGGGGGGAVPSSPVAMPFSIYKDNASADNHYSPSLWWDDVPAVDFACADTPTGGGTSMKLTYSAGGVGWGEIAWVEPWDNNGTNYSNNGYDLSAATKLTFWAKADSAGHQISVQVGDFETATYPDTSKTQSGNITLTTSWAQYTVSLAGKNLTKIQMGLFLAFWTPPYIIYIDDVKFE